MTTLEKIKRYLDRKERFYLSINQGDRRKEYISFSAHKLDFIFELKEQIKEWEKE